MKLDDEIMTSFLCVIELFHLMKKNGFLCKCIIILLPTVVFSLSVSFFKSVGIQ